MQCIERWIGRLFLVIATMASQVVCAEPSPPPYIFVVRPLGTLPGLTHFDATAMNDLGQVIGNAQDSGGRLHTFLYDGVRMRELEALSALHVAVTGINNAGQIVGSAGDQAVMYSAGRITYLGTGTQASSAAAINERGQVTGWAEWRTTGRKAVIFENGTVRNLDTRGDAQWFYSWGNDINENGDVAGVRSQPGADDRRPALFYADGRVAGAGLSPYELWSQSNRAAAINDARQMVGWIDTIFNTSAFMSENGVTHDIFPGRYSSEAYDINNRGQIVGNVGLWEPDGILYSAENLLRPDTPWAVGGLDLINNAGQVAATGCRADGCQLVLLTPVPEPGNAALLAAGLSAIGIALSRRRRICPGVHG